MEARPQRTRGRVRGRGLPTVPGTVLVALVAAFVGLLAGWQLAGAALGPATTATPTPAALVRPALVDDSLRRAFAAGGNPGAWLLCRSPGPLDCRSVEPVRLAPSVAFGPSGRLWSSLPPVILADGGRISMAADMSHAVGVAFSIVSRGGLATDPPTVAGGEGTLYLDVGVLAPGSYMVLGRAELGPPAGGLVEAVARRSGIECRIDLPPAERLEALGRDTSVAVYRVLQEALTNVARHSGAKHAWALLEAGNDELRLEIEDDGRGISAEDLVTPRSLGLKGMRERVLYLGGALEISRAPRGGTRVRAHVPLPGGEAA